MKKIGVALVLVLGAVFGWHGGRDQRHQAAGAASAVPQPGVAEGIFGATAAAPVSVSDLVQNVIEQLPDFVLVDDPASGAHYRAAPAGPSTAVFFEMGEGRQRRRLLAMIFNHVGLSPVLAEQVSVAIDGTPVFADRSTQWLGGAQLPAVCCGLRCADVDGDGDQDLIVCQPGAPSLVYVNRVADGRGFVPTTLPDDSAVNRLFRDLDADTGKRWR